MRHDISLQPDKSSSSGRTGLGDLSPHLYCSILGTCFSMQEIRKLMVRLAGPHLATRSDLAVHEDAVRMASSPTRERKFLEKCLDRRHAATIARFERAKSDHDVREIWEASRRSGDIAGAYWAVMTHRAASVELRQRAFGDVHMLSHLVGASNRADLSRLASLESSHVELEALVEDLRKRLSCVAHERETLARLLEAERRERETVSRRLNEMIDAEGRIPEIDGLRSTLASLELRLSTEIERRERAERRCEAVQTLLDSSAASLQRAEQRENELGQELKALEEAFCAADDARRTSGVLRERLGGSTVLFVGGRSAQIPPLRRFAESIDVTLLHHDGGLEERTGNLPGLVSRADSVLFPVDCISHEASGVLKRACKTAAKPYMPLRSTGLASFVLALKQLSGLERTES